MSLVIIVNDLLHPPPPPKRKIFNENEDIGILRYHFLSINYYLYYTITIPTQSPVRVIINITIAKRINKIKIYLTVILLR